MNESEEQNFATDNLMKAIGKSEVLIEDHEDALDDLSEKTEDLEGWITIFLKVIKSALL
ncbi:MAG: hypothetical protein HON90_09500 [Halobacteriovoraceae bacterium]|nr:hypothetical protein [Halobacteriovoraceae bacterium]